MSNYAKQTTERYELKAGTKTVYQLVSTEESHITEEVYNNIVESSSFFRRLGGSEYHHRCYTSKGYKTWKLISKSPSRDEKTVRTFDLDI